MNKSASKRLSGTVVGIRSVGMGRIEVERPGLVVALGTKPGTMLHCGGHDGGHQ